MNTIIITYIFSMAMIKPKAEEAAQDIKEHKDR
jgi:hypothetical protein